MRSPAVFVALMLLLVTDASAKNNKRLNVSPNACQSGSYSAVNVSEGGTLSILFDNFSISVPPGADRGVERRFCNLQVLLNLPQGYSLGVYEVDYRGFARLSQKQQAELNVDYTVGRKNKGRGFRRRIRGAYEGEFVFSEPLAPGILKRVGCGDAAVLNIAAMLELKTKGQPEEAMVVLDSIDGASPAGLIYHFDLKKCGN